MAVARRCPTCRKVVHPGAETFPFCGARCRDLDLGNWLLERYRIPEPLGTGDGESEAAGDTDRETGEG